VVAVRGRGWLRGGDGYAAAVAQAAARSETTRFDGLAGPPEPSPHRQLRRDIGRGRWPDDCQVVATFQEVVAPVGPVVATVGPVVARPPGAVPAITPAAAPALGLWITAVEWSDKLRACADECLAARRRVHHGGCVDHRRDTVLARGTERGRSARESGPTGGVVAAVPVGNRVGIVDDEHRANTGVLLLRDAAQSQLAGDVELRAKHGVLELSLSRTVNREVAPPYTDSSTEEATSDE